MRLTAAEYSQGFLSWSQHDALRVSVGTAKSRQDEIQWTEPLANPEGSLIGMELGPVVTFRLQGAEGFDVGKLWVKLECVQADVLYTRIWEGVPNGAPVILSHVPDYGNYHRLVVDPGFLGWDTDLVFRYEGVLIRLVTGNIQGEASGGMKAEDTADGKITITGSQETVTANGRFIEVVTPGETPEQAELYAHSLLGLLAIALGQTYSEGSYSPSPGLPSRRSSLGSPPSLAPRFHDRRRLTNLTLSTFL